VTEPNFFEVLARALAVLEAEVPEASAELARVLAGIALALSVDAEVRCLTAHSGRIVLQETGPAGPALQTRRVVLVELLEARRTLLDAILRDELLLRGAPAELAAIYDGLSVFIRGALRSRAMAALLEEYIGHEKRPSRRLARGLSAGERRA
jgi:hypothetical protein